MLWSPQLTARYHHRFQSTLIFGATNGGSRGLLACLRLRYHRRAVRPSLCTPHLPARFLQLLRYPHKKKPPCFQPDGCWLAAVAPPRAWGRQRGWPCGRWRREAHPSQGRCRFGQLSGIVSPQPCFHGCPAMIAGVFSHSLSPALLCHHKPR